MTAPAPSSSRRWIGITVGVVLAIALVFRFVTTSDLWLDEALTVNVAELPLGDIPEWLRHDGAPPLYYLVLHLWTAVFGTSDLSVRSLSGIFAVATLPAIYFAGRRMGGRQCGWLAVIVLAARPSRSASPPRPGCTPWSRCWSCSATSRCTVHWNVRPSAGSRSSP